MKSPYPVVGDVWIYAAGHVERGWPGHACNRHPRLGSRFFSNCQVSLYFTGWTPSCSSTFTHSRPLRNFDGMGTRTPTEESSRMFASGQDEAYSLAVVRENALSGYADRKDGAIPCQWLGLFASSITTSKHAITTGSVRTTGRGHKYTSLEF